MEWNFKMMMIKLSPMLMMSLDRIKVLDLEALHEHDQAKARRIIEDRSREVAHLLMLLNGDIEAQRAAAC
jgi:hypothetical protein